MTRLSSLSSLLCLLACARPVPTVDVPPEVVPTPSHTIDLAGFSALVPVAQEVDGASWIAFDRGASFEPRHFPIAPVGAGRGACATRSGGLTWTFPSDPPMRLQLAQHVALEAFDGACWRPVAQAPVYTRGKTLRARGSTREALTLALGKLDARLVEATLHGDEVSVATREEALTEAFDDVMMTDWGPDDPTDYDQEFEHERTLEVTALHGPDGALAALHVHAHEVGDGDPGWQGGSHHHIRDTDWYVRLDVLGTTEFTATSSASFSGDGASGTDYANVRRVRHVVPGGVVAGEWTTRGPRFSDEATWTLETDIDGFEIGLPRSERLDVTSRGEAKAMREDLTSHLTVSVSGPAIRVERAGHAPVVVPLLAAPYGDRERVVLGVSRIEGQAFYVEVVAFRLLDEPQIGDYGEEITTADHTHVRLFISANTPQVLRLTEDRIEPL
jgi:hypothetical protein